MAVFAYIARDPSGKKVEGRVAAPTAQAVLTELQGRQLAPVRVQEVRDRALAGGRGMQRRVSTRELANAYRQLADLLRAGVPLMRGLRLLSRNKSNPRLANVMNTVADAVADGSRLADALEAHDDIFPDIQIAMIRAGERGGFLEPVLNRLGTFLEHQADMRGRVVGNLIYPVAILLLGVAIIIVAMVVFVPKFKDFYTRIQLPWPTKLLLGASDVLTNYWLVAIIVIAALATLLWRAWQIPAVRRQLMIAQVRLPKIGALTRSLAVGRFARILGTLLSNGIPMLQAMQIARDAAGNILLAEAIDRAAEAVRSGETLAVPLAQSGLFAEDVVEMIAVGESANNLPVVLVTIADTIDKRVDRMLNLFVRLMEPVLLLMLAGVVVFIFVALIVPMMRMSASLSGE
jgi:general secretion pathway protein F/type IV pilus assembly protein PilC